MLHQLRMTLIVDDDVRSVLPLFMIAGSGNDAPLVVSTEWTALACFDPIALRRA